MPNSADIQSRTQEVFRLRKGGKLTEALLLGASLHREHATDDWATRAYAWTLYDEIKRLRNSPEGPALGCAILELSQLKIPPADDVLMQQVSYILQSASPEGRALGEATQLSQAGQHGDAVRIARPFVGVAGTSRATALSYGWVLYRKIKATDGVAGLAHRIWCFEEYLRVWSREWIPDPMLTKCLLLEGTKNAENWGGFVQLVSGMGLDKLTERDWVDERPNADFPPFQHQILKAIYQCLKHHPSERKRTDGLHVWLHAWESALSGSDWPDYHLGRILVWTDGDRVKARALLLKTVQQNPAEFWRWSALADAVEPQQRVAVLARAVVCLCENAQFKTGLYRDFAEELAKVGLISEASASFEEFLRRVRLAGKEFNGALPSWYQGAGHVGKIDLPQRAQMLGQEAEDLLVEALPDYLGVLICKLPPKEGKKGDAFLYYFEQLGVRSVKFKGAAPPLDTPAVLLKMREKPEGVSLAFRWTVAEVPAALGVQCEAFVNTPNLAKGLVPLMTREHPFIPLNLQRWPGAERLKFGDCVSLRMLMDAKAKPVVLGWAKLPEGTMIPGVTIKIAGEFKAVDGKAFGFITSGLQKIFVGPREARGLSDRQFVAGIAIKSEDKHGRESWMYVNPN